MQKTESKINITTKSGRSKLAARREPYWTRIAKGHALGFRCLKEGEGTWIARWIENGSTKKHYKALGELSEYDLAANAAREWFQHCEQGARPQIVTVTEACKAYVAKLRSEKGKASSKDAEGRFIRRVYDAKIGKLPLDKIRTDDVRKWRDSFLDGIDEEDDELLRKAKDSANRNLSSLKAALNTAYRDKNVGSDSGWRTVTAFRKVGSRRKHFLTIDQRRELIKHCPPELALLVEAMLHTAARPGELASLSSENFDKHAGTLTYLKGKTGERTITLSSKAIAFFKQQVKGMIGKASIFKQADGTDWNKDDWKKVFKEATKNAGLPPDVVMYSLRHTAISQMIEDGMDSFIVAKLAGTSVTMIEKHYGHLRHDRTRAKLDMVQML